MHVLSFPLSTSSFFVFKYVTYCHLVQCIEKVLMGHSGFLPVPKGVVAFLSYLVPSLVCSTVAGEYDFSSSFVTLGVQWPTTRFITVCVLLPLERMALGGVCCRQCQLAPQPCWLPLCSIVIGRRLLKPGNGCLPLICVPSGGFMHFAVLLLGA